MRQLFADNLYGLPLVTLFTQRRPNVKKKNLRESISNNNNNNKNRISIPPSVVTSEAVAEPIRSRKSAIVG